MTWLIAGVARSYKVLHSMQEWAMPAKKDYQPTRESSLDSG